MIIPVQSLPSFTAWFPQRCWGNLTLGGCWYFHLWKLVASRNSDSDVKFVMPCTFLGTLPRWGWLMEAAVTHAVSLRSFMSFSKAASDEPLRSLFSWPPKEKHQAVSLSICNEWPLLVVVVVQLLSCVRLCDPMDCSMPGFPVFHLFLEFAQTLVHWAILPISSAAAPFSFCPQFFPASGPFPMGQLFPSGDWSIRASVLASVLPMNIKGWLPLEFTGLISAVQGTLKSLLQHHSLKASVLQCPAFFMVQLSHPYITGKTIPLTRQTIVGKVMSLFFNMLSRLIIAFFLLVSRLQSPSAVILEPPKNKIYHYFHCFPIYCHSYLTT